MSLRKSQAHLGERPQIPSDEQQEELKDYTGIQDPNQNLPAYTYQVKNESILSFQNSQDHDEDDDRNLSKHVSSPSRPPISRIDPQKPDYYRLKYNNKIQNLANAKGSFLQIPVHIADNYLRQSTFYGPVIMPFRSDQQGRSQKQGSIATIFSYWNTMLGSGILCLPWTFYHSGIVLGIIICFLSYLCSLRTCILVHRITAPGDDFYDTIRKYWGNKGYFLAISCTLIIIQTACTAYFLVMCQMLYPIILALLKWIGGLDLPVETEAMTFHCFSQTWTSFIMFFVMIFVCLQRDLSIFIKMTSYGAISIILIAFFIIGVGIKSLMDTPFKIMTIPDPQDPEDFEKNMRQIFLINNNFTPLAGVLGIGYFLHPVSIPIARNSINQKNNERDLFWGYTLVFLSYILIGFTGYFGFSSVTFKDFVKTASLDNRPIAQNCIMMFSRTNVPAFFLRLVVFNLVFASFPILNFFFRAGILKVYLEATGNEKPRDGEYIIDAQSFNILTVIILLIPLSISVFYPQIAKILGYVGAVAGIFVLYALPIFTYLIKLKNESDNPIISQAQQLVQNHQSKKLYQDKEEEVQKLNESSSSSTKMNNQMFEFGLQNNKEADLKQYWNQNPSNRLPIARKSEIILKNKMKWNFYYEVGIHSLIMIYGLLVLMMTFYNPLK